jgi:tol-pal system protein YbgF
MKQKVFAAAGALVVAVMAAPAAAADKEQRQMMADIRMLQEQAQLLQNALASVTEALKAVNARMDSRFDEQTTMTRKALADQKVVIDAISHDLGAVREKLDDNTTRVGTLSQEVDALRQLVQQGSLSRPSVPDAVDTAAAAAPPPDSPAAPPSAPALGTSPRSSWDAAYGDYTLGQYELAVAGFEAYIRNFPKSDLADDAQVYIGNSYLNAGQNEKAVAAYDLAIRTYPSGNAIPEAYYRKGLALQNLKQSDAARDAFQTVIQKYPESTAATLASQRLTDLKKP